MIAAVFLSAMGRSVSGIHDTFSLFRLVTARGVFLGWLAADIVLLVQLVFLVRPRLDVVILVLLTLVAAVVLISHGTSPFSSCSRLSQRASRKYIPILFAATKRRTFLSAVR
jgi:hypothetical protein